MSFATANSQIARNICVDVDSIATLFMGDESHEYDYLVEYGDIPCQIVAWQSGGGAEEPVYQVSYGMPWVAAYTLLSEKDDEAYPGRILVRLYPDQNSAELAARTLALGF
jgi:hypothetical protein